MSDKQNPAVRTVGTAMDFYRRPSCSFPSELSTCTSSVMMWEKENDHELTVESQLLQNSCIIKPVWRMLVFKEGGVGLPEAKPDSYILGGGWISCSLLSPPHPISSKKCSSQSRTWISRHGFPCRPQGQKASHSHPTLVLKLHRVHTLVWRCQRHIFRLFVLLKVVGIIVRVMLSLWATWGVEGVSRTKISVGMGGSLVECLLSEL